MGGNPRSGFLPARRRRAGKSSMVDLGGIEPPSPQCECGVLPLYYRPLVRLRRKLQISNVQLPFFNFQLPILWGCWEFPRGARLAPRTNSRNTAGFNSHRRQSSLPASPLLHFVQSGCWELNPGHRVPNPVYYRYTTPRHFAFC